ncbi:MAG: DUF3604 domain-containing protein [bacterium]|nr:DUF3604 domain-containing protein [bacterium]
MQSQWLLVASLLLLFGSTATSETRERCSDRDPLRRPFFGDTHVHTTFSFDAWGQGTLGTPDDAYRYAKGERVGIQPYDTNGASRAFVQLRRPLDFAIVTDHSDLLGETDICKRADLPGHDSLVCGVMRRFPALGYVLINGHVYSSEVPSRYSFCGNDGEHCHEAAKDPWRITLEAAKAHDDRSQACRFTTFVGYEWTGMPGGNNIHRNVIFESEIAQDFPTTYIETPTAEGLWQSLLDECIEGKPGCDAIAIPHNSNVSNGSMWPLVGDDGKPIDAQDARLRARLEPLVEVTQHKGDSECRAGAEDELCGYETLNHARMQDMMQPNADFEAAPRVYARETLTAGLVEQTRIGVNPFQFGLIGSTDSHLATPGRVDEDEYLGHAAGTVSARFGVPAYPDRPEFNPGGLAVLWAEENSRPALFAAMKRREAYATSGPRIVARFFGGWDFDPGLCDARDLVARGYADGVAMGGELAARQSGSTRAPAFVVSALRDPAGRGVPSTPLQRIQIIKGWVEQGEPRERVFEIAGDADSPADVDLATCTPRGPGHDELCTVWRDPEFDATSPAYYYARILENPSCRWNRWVCMRASVDCESGKVPEGLEACCDPSIPETIQERVWTSPIWYTPETENSD